MKQLLLAIGAVLATFATSFIITWSAIDQNPRLLMLAAAYACMLVVGLIELRTMRYQRDVQEGAE